MAIQAQLADGRTLEFPDGTDPTVIQSTVKRMIAEAAPPERTMGQAFGDVGSKLVSGLGGLAQFPGQVYGLATGEIKKPEFASTGLYGLGQQMQDWAKAHESEGLKAKEAATAAKVAQSEQQGGQFAAFKTQAGEVLKDPAQLTAFLAEQAPQAIPSIIAAMIPGVGPAAAAEIRAAQLAARTATSAAAKEAAEVALKDAVSAATKSQVGRGASAAVRTGAVQQGADVGAGTYENAYKTMISQGATPEEAANKAINLARAAGVGGAALSLLAAKLPGAQAFERALAGEKLGKGAGAAARIGQMAVGAAKEIPGEQAEEVGGKLLQNVAQRQVNPEQSLTEGLGQTAAQAAIGAGGMGAIGGIRSGRAAPVEEKLAPPVQEIKEMPEPPRAKPLSLGMKAPFVPRALPDGSVANTQEELDAYERNQFEQKYAPQKADEKRLSLGVSEPFKPVVFPDGSVATTPEEVKQYEQESFKKKYEPQAVPAEPKPEPYVAKPSLTATDLAPKMQAGPAGGEMASMLAQQREQKEAKAEVPLTDNYEFLQREKQRLLQEAQTPEVKTLIKRIEDRSGELLARDIERSRKDKEMAAKSVFGQEELPPTESRDYVMADKALGELQAKEEPVVPMDRKEKASIQRFEKLQGTPAPKSELEQQITGAEQAAASIKSTDLNTVLKGKLRPDEVADIAPRGKGFEKLSSGAQKGTYISEMVADGMLNDYLPPDMHPGSSRFDAEAASEIIKNKLREKDTGTFEASFHKRVLGNQAEQLAAELQRDKEAELALSEVEKPDFKRTLNNGQGIGVAATQGVVNNIKSQWKNAPETVVASSMNDAVIPPEVRAHNEAQKKKGAKGEPEAFIHKGKVYLIADKLDTPAAAMKAYYHEALGHYGLRGVFGKDIEGVLGQILKHRDADVRKIAERYGFDMNKASDRMHAAEEVLTHMAQEKPGLTFVRQAIAAIRNWLRTHGFNVKLSDNDIIQGMIIPAQKFVERGAKAKVEGKTSYSRAPAVGSDAFKKWFGGSKVVDDNGNPLVVYHGTKAFDEYGEQEGEAIRQFAGLPNWFAEEPYTASGYAGAEGTMYPVYLSIKKPLSITNFEMNDDASAAYALANSLGVDIASLYLAKEAKAYNVVSSPQFVEAAQKAGYDGIKVKEGDYNTYAAFEPTQIKSATGNNGEYSSNNPDISYSRAREAAEKVKTVAKKALQNRKPIDTGAMQGVDEAYVKALGKVFNPENKTIVDKIDGLRDGFWKKVAQGVADQYRSIKDYSQEAYMLARLSKTVDGALDGLLMHGHVFLDSGALNIKQNTKGLMEALHPVGAETDRYMMWVALNREARLPESKRSFNLTDLVGRRGELAQGTINGKPRLEVYEGVQKDMNALNKSVLDIARKQGLIDEDAYKRFSSDLFYIPFYKAMEDGDIQGASSAAGLTGQKFSAELKGQSEKPFGDLMENTLRNWSSILSASMKNQASNKTIEAAMEVDAATPSLKVGLEWKDGKVYSTKSGEMVGDGELRGNMTTSTKGAIKTMIGGQPAYFEVHDPMLMDAITSIGYMGPKSKMLDVARDFKNYLQFGVTLSPAFKVRNLFRDSISALAISDLKRNPFANVIDGWIATDKNNPAHISALAGGAIFNFGTIDEGNQAKAIKRLIKMGVAENTILDTPDKVKAGLKKAFDVYQDWGNKSEAANRMALYNQMKAKGMSHLEASFAARDMLDFSMQGSWQAFRLVTQVVPFLNARVQGLYKLGRDGVVPTSRVLYNTATGKPLDQTDIQKAQSFGYTTLAVAMASMALYMAFKDDEDYQKRDEWDRDNFWWFKVPGIDYAFRVPKPFEIGAIGTIAERTLEQIVDSGAEGKQFEDSIKRMLADTFAMNPIPQAVKPLIDLYANKDSFTGAPIETAGMERLSKQERSTDTTSPLAKALGAASSMLGEKGELSPVQVDYAIKAYFGWLGGTVAETSHYAVMPFKDGEYPDAKLMDRVSLGFVKSLPSDQSRYVTAFYENNKQISQAFADMRHYSEAGEMEKVAELMEEKGDKIALNKLYDQTSKQMANVRKQIRVVTNSEDMSGADKREEITRLKEILSMYAQNAEEVRKSMK